MQKPNSYAQQLIGQFPAAELNKDDRKLLKKFRTKMDKLQQVLCLVCNKSCASCRRCYSEKIMPNRFSAENNMDPGEVPIELKDLMKIEEMLITKAFTVISVYRFRGGQYGYRGDVINFLQNINEFTTHLLKI